MMPTYRRPGYLRGALTAALGQTYKNLQIVVRDNASADETPEVVREFRDPRIEFYQSSHTTSPSENGEECLRLARGEYCMTLADDDLIMPNYVETLADALQNKDDIAIAYASGAFMDEKGEVTGRKTPAGSYAMDSMDFLMAWCRVELPLVTPACMMLRTSWLREVAPELGNTYFPEGHHSDTAFMIWVALRGKVFFTDKTCYSYRVHGGNTCARLTNAQNLAGDSALLAFIQSQKEGEAGRRLSDEEWNTFEKAAGDQLTKTYYWRVMSKDLESYKVGAFLTEIIIHPSRVYSFTRVVGALFSKRSEINSWLKSRIRIGAGKEKNALTQSNITRGESSVRSSES